MTTMDNKYEIDLSIIIVNWNVKALLRECLSSIYEKTSAITFEIIVVDNASSDGSVEMVRIEFPQVKLLANCENLGFARANNLALPSTVGEYLGLLNPDTVLINNAFGMMIEKLGAEPRIGIVGPKLLTSNGIVQEPCARRFTTLKSRIQWLLTSRRINTPFSDFLPLAEYANSQLVDCVSGACLTLNRDVLTDERIFDPQFFMYVEDVDLCYETIQRGWTVFYLSEALVIHHGDQSASQDPISIVLYTVRATYRFLVKRYGRHTGFIFRFFCVIIPIMKFAIIQLVRIVPRYRCDPVWEERNMLYPQIIRCALYIEE